MLNDSSKPVRKTPAGFPHPIVAALIAAAIFIGGQVVGVIGLSVLVVATGGGLDGLTVFGNAHIAQFAYIALVEAATLLALAMYCRRRGLTRRDFGLVRPRPVDVLWAAGAFVVYFLAYAVLLQLVSTFVPGFDSGQKQDIGFDDVQGPAVLALVFVSLVVLPPITEEILMRGFFFGALRRRYKYVAAALVTSVAFAALHLWGGEQGAGLLWVAAVDTFVLSMVLCYLREKTGRLWASILLHATKNGVAFLLLFVFVQGS